MINTYKKALLEWNLDGFKLDSVDTWRDNSDNAPYNENMDIPALQDAVDVCMTGVVEELLKIKPDILLEFRQSYVGPHMKRFGNMFRVGDCAGNYLRNREAILDLRMMMGSQAVHSDMLMMCPYEKVENNAIQIVSCMFGVLQYSGRMEEMTQELAEMSVFWLNFLKNHKALLLEGKLEAYEPHLVYTWAKSTLDNECAVGVYAIDKCVKPDRVDTIYLANGCAGERILVELTGDYGVRVLDCRGHEVSNSQMALDGITALSVPSGGLAVLKK
jgi:alpha-galactosidase